MMRAALAALVALLWIVGDLGAYHAFGDLLSMFSRGLGATGSIIFVLASSAYAVTLSLIPGTARAIVAAHRSYTA